MPKFLSKRKSYENCRKYLLLQNYLLKYFDGMRINELENYL